MKIKQLLFFVFLSIKAFFFLFGQTEVEIIDNLKKAIKEKDSIKQDEILSSVKDNLEFQRVINKLFENDERRILNYLAKRKRIAFVKSYFGRKDIDKVPQRFKLMERALAKGALELVQYLNKKGNVKIKEEDLINNFAGISKVYDIKKIEKFWNFLEKGGFSNLLIRAMIDQRDVFKKNKTLRALLHFAARRCNVVWLRFLIKKGVPLDLRDKVSKTPLHLAMESTYKGALNKKLEVLRIFKNAGLKILLRDRSDKTARDYVKDFIVFYKDDPKQFTVYKKLLEEMKDLQRD